MKMKQIRVAAKAARSGNKGGNLEVICWQQQMLLSKLEAHKQLA